MEKMGVSADMAGVPTPARARSPAGVITLRGSTDTVVEFFGFAISSILFQRGVFSPDRFVPMKKYGLSVLVASDQDLQNYIGEVLVQLKGWMMRSQVKKVVMVILSQASNDTLERWTFDVRVNAAAAAAEAVQQTHSEVAECQKEIQAIIRQITASVTFLPLLDEPCTFELLIYTDQLAEVPQEWGESDPMHIVGGSQEVRLRSFSTKIHRVEGAVAYKYNL